MTGEHSNAGEAYASLFIEDLRVLLLQPAGRRFIRGLFAKLGLFSSCCIPGAAVYARTKEHEVAIWLFGAILQIRPGFSPDVLGRIMFGNDGEYNRLLEEERGVDHDRERESGPG
jgi:hypothetical protein